MKRVVVAVIFLCLIIGLGIGEQLYLSRSFDRLEADIVAVSEMQETSEAVEKMNEIVTSWQSRSKILTIFAPHVDIKDIVVLLAEYKGFIEVGSHDEAEVQKQKLLAFLQDRRNILSFSWQNVL